MKKSRNSVPTSAGIETDNVQRMLKLIWPGGKTSQFHYVWLRHSGRLTLGMANDTSVKIDLLPDNLAWRRTGLRLANNGR